MRDRKDNSGALFRNDKKEADNHPDYTGNCMIDGKEFWINAWLKDGKNGKFMSFSFKPKQARQQQEHEARKDDDHIPF